MAGEDVASASHRLQGQAPLSHTVSRDQINKVRIMLDISNPGYYSIFMKTIISKRKR